MSSMPYVSMTPSTVGAAQKANFCKEIYSIKGIVMLSIPPEGVRHDERYHDDDQPCQPVCVGRDLRRHCFFAPLWEQVQLPQKSVRYRPIEKVLDGLLGILCGAKTIAQSNSTILVDPA